MIKIELSKKAEDVVAHFANKLGMSLEAYSRKAILEFTEDQEDLERVEESLKDPGENIKHEEVMARHGLEH